MPGSSEIINGRDYLLTDADILKFLVSRTFDFKKVIPDMKYHLEWRQTNIPRVRLNDRLVNILNKGLMYIHGRSKDYSPIVITSYRNLGEMLSKKEIVPTDYCMLANFVTTYVTQNMMIPGQVEKVMSITDLNNFSLKDMPVGMFKDCAKEL